MDVLLVCMPFCDEFMPCVTYALFKSLLAQEGIKSRIIHEYLHYATWIGKGKYRKIMKVCTIGYGHDYFACETIFSNAAFDKTVRSFDEYIDWMKNTHLPGKVFSGNQFQDTMECLSILEEAHDKAADYLEEAAGRIMAQNPRIVAFTSMFQQHNAIIALAKRLKKEKKPPIIVVGGPNCHNEAGSALIEKVPAIDYVFTGEADTVFAVFCKRLLCEGSVPDEDLPPGVLSRTRTTSGPADITRDLDLLPVPDFSDYFHERDLLFPEYSSRYVITAEGSRGCWWAARHPCRFCALNGCAADLYREKSVSVFADELTELSKKYPHAQCLMTDNVLSLNHLKELPAELSKREEYMKNRLRLFCEIKSNVTEAEIINLTTAGFYWFQAGIESFSDRILKLMNKGASAIRQVQLMKHCRAHGIALMWYVLVGTPGETPEMCHEGNEVIKKIMHLNPPHTVAHVMYLRHNYYMEHPGENVPALAPDKGYDFVFPDSDFIRRSAHLFAPTDKQELESYYDYRLLGPDYEELYTLTELWIHKPQKLMMLDNGKSVLILDTRVIAKSPASQLNGVHAQLCRKCRNTVGEDELFSDLSGSYSKAQIQDALSSLIESNLILNIGREYLTLAVDYGPHATL